jgi:polyisoprenoid-binding protein YceI
MMKKILFLTGAILLQVGLLTAQERYFTKTAYLSFLSETLIENIFAETNDASSFLDIKTGDVVFSVAITSFQFKSKLMQEHFNENYLESGKFPKATFSGKLENFSGFDINSKNPQSIVVKGKMNIHGTDQEVTANVILTVAGSGKISATSTFILKPEEYHIKIPSAVGMKIAKEVTISVKANYEPYKP